MRARLLGATGAAALLLMACGNEGARTASTTAETTTTAQTSTIAETTTTAQTSTTDHVAIWPTISVVMPTPQDAAADFVSEVLGVEPVLGEFRAGDQRSGEIEVLSPGEGQSAVDVHRGTLLVRQLGPRDGWFVIGAVGVEASITSPVAAAVVTAGPLEMSGSSHGFEASATVSARVAGTGDVLDSEVILAGSMEAAGPFSVTLDLSAAEPGQTVLLLVQGGVGLESDPGDFAAIPVVIG